MAREHDWGLWSQIWWWLPARASRGRVTTVSVISVGVGSPPEAVAVALVEMEACGYAIRDRSVGTRAGSWHRGLPVEPPAVAVAVNEQGTLF